MFKNGTASIKDVDDAVSELHKKQQVDDNESKENPYWPGRYDPQDDECYFTIAHEGKIHRLLMKVKFI